MESDPAHPVPALLEWPLAPDKPVNGQGVEVKLAPGVSPAFRPALRWTAAGAGWELKGVGVLDIPGVPAPGKDAPITQWLVCGPFPNDALGRLDEGVRGPERRLDLAAQYDTLDGKAGWKAVSGTRVDFTALFGKRHSASAFALAVLRAKKPVAYALDLSQAALTINGESRFVPRAQQVSGTLKPGDNVILLRVVNQGDNWGASARLSLAANADPADVEILPCSRFHEVAALNPPARPAIPEGASLPFADGYHWKLVYEDDFDRVKLGTDWIPWEPHSWAESKSWYLQDGRLASRAPNYYEYLTTRCGSTRPSRRPWRQLEDRSRQDAKETSMSARIRAEPIWKTPVEETLRCART